MNIEDGRELIALHDAMTAAANAELEIIGKRTQEIAGEMQSLMMRAQLLASSVNSLGAKIDAVLRAEGHLAPEALPSAPPDPNLAYS